MRSRTSLGALIGLLSAAVAVGVGELAAAFVRPESSPVIAVGSRIIVITPEDAKRSGIQAAGTNDKLWLLIGIYLLLAAFGALIGVAALRKLGYGLAGIAAVGAIGVYCALTANASQARDVIPTLVGTAASMAVLATLVWVAHGWTPEDHADAARWPARRTLLQAGAATAAVAAVTGFGGRAAQHARFDVAATRDKIKLPAPAATAPTVPPGVDLGKSKVSWATSSNKFYRIDTALSVPQIDSHSWKLRIHGMVDKELTLTYAQLLARPQIERWITLCCVSNEIGGNLVSNAHFQGARLADLLREAGVRKGADQLLLRSQDGMTIGAPIDLIMDGRDALLAVGMNGKPLPVEHGFPARTVVPGLYGYVSACKWIVDMEVTTFDAHRAYWVQGGWSPEPPIQLQSRIDTPGTQQVVSAGDTIAVAGVAWDQHVGVSKVEVQVDDGPWQRARLAAVPSTDTWRQWVWPWTPQKSGEYRLRVRATDALGNVQDTQVRQPFPSGATGLHAVTVRAVV